MTREELTVSQIGRCFSRNIVAHVMSDHHMDATLVYVLLLVLVTRPEEKILRQALRGRREGRGTESSGPSRH